MSAEDQAAAKDQAAKDQAAEDQAAKDQAAKDQAAKDQGAKDQAAKDQAAEDQAAEDQAAEDQAAEDQAAKEQAAKETQTEATEATTDHSGLAAIIFWVIVLALLGYWWFAPHNRALVFLEASATQPLQVNGVVMFKGAPVTKGTISLVFDDPNKNQYLAGKILSIGKDGRFETSGPELVALTESEQGPKATAKPAKSPKPLRVAVTFSGQTQEEKKNKTSTPTTVTGKTTLYLNCSPPVSKRVIWGSIIIIFCVGAFLITLFTGDLTQRKARLLFSTSYIVIFLSLALPIFGIVLVSKNPDAVEVMQHAAIGLVKGTGSTILTPQWLVNLGGVVSPATKQTEVSPTKEGLKTPLPEESVVAVSPNPAQEQSPISEGNGGTDETLFKVTGGLAVPFYVVFLATLGAGIYMTKKVPDIQRRHDIEPLQGDEPTGVWNVVVSTFRAPGEVFRPTETRVKSVQEIKTTFEIRKELIDIYMGLISAPFLAVAVYYLLQVIAKDTAEPVLVVVSFATGFISDRIVTAITNFGVGALPPTADQAAKDQAAKDQAAKDQAAKDEAPEDQAAKDQAAKDQAAKDQAAKDQAAKDQAAKDQAAKDQAAKAKDE